MFSASIKQKKDPSFPGSNQKHNTSISVLGVDWDVLHLNLAFKEV